MGFSAQLNIHVVVDSNGKHDIRIVHLPNSLNFNIDDKTWIDNCI